MCRKSYRRISIESRQSELIAKSCKRAPGSVLCGSGEASGVGGGLTGVPVVSPPAHPARVFFSSFCRSSPMFVRKCGSSFQVPSESRTGSRCETGENAPGSKPPGARRSPERQGCGACHGDPRPDFTGTSSEVGDCPSAQQYRSAAFVEGCVVPGPTRESSGVDREAVITRRSAAARQCFGGILGNKIGSSDSHSRGVCRRRQPSRGRQCSDRAASGDVSRRASAGTGTVRIDRARAPLHGCLGHGQDRRSGIYQSPYRAVEGRKPTCAQYGSAIVN